MEDNDITYESISDEIDYQKLDNMWQYDKDRLAYFSKDIVLYDYQLEALEKAAKLMWLLYCSFYNYPNSYNYTEFLDAKKKLYDQAKAKNKKLEDLNINNKRSRVFKEIDRYYDYKEEHDIKSIDFYNFVNRMSFWMATGSGKTIVIIKIIEYLDYLIRNNVIPNNDILVLTYREDLISQFKNHIELYNRFHERKISVYSLKDYDKVKFESLSFSKDDINIFIYRSDLISNESKEKEISYEDIENDGKWYIILDEAHKGDKEYSKRQVYFSLLTRFGFLFNFSATFTHQWDIVTTVYNFNLPNFIEKGYGKHLYLSNVGINFDKFDEKDKEKTILKGLILLSAIKKAKTKLPTKLKYHNPLMVVYGNSVNTDSSDLKVIFKVIEKIGNGISMSTFKAAKEELKDELSKDHEYEFKEEEFQPDIDLINEINEKEILKEVFNSDRTGKIEVITVPGIKEEMIFKIKSSDKLFAMIKIGDIKEWLRNEFSNYEINERYENKSYFAELNNPDNPVNILLGSRAFYEGWDSNRPNIMMFINIGVGDSKKHSKYITQSIGRGERIEPLQHKRKRLRILNEEDSDEGLFKDEYKRYIQLLETLFIFGTDSDNIKQILKAIKVEKDKNGRIIELEKNEEEIDDKLLLIPIYRSSKEVELSEIPKFNGNYKLIKDFWDWIDSDKLFYAIYHEYIKPSDINRIKDYIKIENFENDKNNNIESVLLDIIELLNHIKISIEKFEKFKQIEDEIVHFKQITAYMDDKDLELLKEKIQKVITANSNKQLEELKRKHELGEMTLDEYTEKVRRLGKEEKETISFDNRTLKIENLRNHYYIPVLISEDSKEDLINHIIKEESERKFIEHLEEYVDKNQVYADYWFFSKIDENLDKIYIPYYDKEHNKMSKFFPDFIFWIKRDNNYYIIFVDPKGTKHTSYEYKVDGFSRIFENYDKPRIFVHEGNKVIVRLYLYTQDEKMLPEKYKKYWFDNIRSIFNISNN